MAGHSKWNNIKNKKGAEDAKRAQLFTYIGKNIRLAAKNGGGEVNNNPNLRTWVEKAKEANMPKDKIQRSIDVGTGKISGGVMQEINYECFGPDGVGIIVMAVTDNNNRTSSELRALLSRAGGSLGGPGCASYMFEFDKERQEYKAVMPMEIGEETRDKLVELVEKILQIEGVEGVYTATEALFESD